MTVADHNMYDVLDNAREVDFEDENEWDQVYALDKGRSGRNCRSCSSTNSARTSPRRPGAALAVDV